jgi:hypothetical protein
VRTGTAFLVLPLLRRMADMLPRVWCLPPLPEPRPRRRESRARHHHRLPGRDRFKGDARHLQSLGERAQVQRMSRHIHVWMLLPLAPDCHVRTCRPHPRLPHRTLCARVTSLPHQEEGADQGRENAQEAIRKEVSRRRDRQNKFEGCSKSKTISKLINVLVTLWGRKSRSSSRT